MAWGNPLDEAALDRFRGNLPGGPVADGSVTACWYFANEGHQLAPLFGGNPRRRPGPGLVRQPLGSTLFCQGYVLPVPPTLPPQARGGGGHPELTGDLPIVQPGRGGEHEAGTQGKLLRSGMPVDQGFQGLLLGRAEGKIRRSRATWFCHRGSTPAGDESAPF